MKAQITFTTMEKINKNVDSRYRDVNFRLLKFIYDDIYQKGINEKMAEVLANEDKMYSNESIKRQFDAMRSRLSIFLEGNNSIIHYYNQLLDCDDKRFIFEFSNFVEPYFSLIDNHYYEENDFNPISIMFNIYAWLKAFSTHKNDFDGFVEIVRDFKPLVDCTEFSRVNYFSNDFSYGSEFFLSYKKEYIDALLSVKKYKDLDIIRSRFRRAFADMGKSFFGKYLHEGEASVVSKYFNSISEDYDKLVAEYEGKNKTICALSDIYLLFFKNGDKPEYYNKALLFGNRINYVLNHFSSLSKIGCPSSKTEERLERCFMGKLKRIDYHLYDYLDDIKIFDSDSFERCMDIILDSDTFYEVDSKLNLLISASTAYEYGKKEDIESIIRDLGSVNNKKFINGKPVAYGIFNENDKNYVKEKKKPHFTIYKRMLALYSDIYPKEINISKLMSEVIEATFADFDKTLDLLLSEKVIRLEEAKAQAIKNEQTDKKNESDIPNVPSNISSTSYSNASDEIDEISEGVYNSSNDLSSNELNPVQKSKGSRFGSLFGKRN